MATTLLVCVPPAASAQAEGGLFTVPAQAAGVPTIHDGDPATTERLLRSEAVSAAIAVSQQRFAAASAAGRHADHAVLARSDDFADALSGSSLLRDAPLLLTPGSRLDERVAEELERVVAPGARVYLLGGEQALGSQVAQAVAGAGYRVVRLAGSSRVETSIRVAQQAQEMFGRRELLVARAFGTSADPSAAWADSVAASGLATALGLPLVVTGRESLHPAVARFVAETRPTRTVVLGGPAALSVQVEATLPNAVRLAGADRTATSVAIAVEGWGAPTTGPRRHVVVDGSRADGWTLGLAAAGLSADARAPIVLVTQHLGGPVRALLGTCGEPEVDLAVMGDGTRVSASVRERLDALDADACGTAGSLRPAQRLHSFATSGCDAVLAYYQELALERVGPWGLDGGVSVMPVVDDAEAAPAPGAGDDSGGEAPALSGTNVQEAGVDEPDIVKTDGDRAVAVARGKLQVLDLTGAAPVVASTVELPPGAHQLLLDGTRVLVLSRSYPYWEGPEPTPAEPTANSVVMPGPARTSLTLLDIADVFRPVPIATSEVEGEYRAARLIDGTVRIAVQASAGPFTWSYPEDDSADAMERAAEANREVIRRSTIEDWLPTFTTRNADGATTGDGLLVPCGSVAAPPRPSDLGTVAVVTLEMVGALLPSSGAGIAASTETVYASTDRLVIATQRWTGWTPDAGDTGTTELHAFDIRDPAATRYVASGAVAGFLLSSFSLSRHEGYLRVATTEGTPWGPEPSSSSTLSVLLEDGPDLRVVGRVDGLGKGERIFAVRFLGDLAAVVTFRQVDPLYLIDLSSPAAPRVSGELKIPGYSSYLHPTGSLLIGVGQDADEQGRTLGTQVATYDISDPAVPRQVAKQVFPNSHSEVEWDHKAFLHWPAASLAVVPIDEWTEAGPGFHGAVGLHVGATGSLSERGRIAHPPSSEWPATVRRAFVVDDLLYTLSDVGLRADRVAGLGQVSWTPFA